MSSTGLLRSVLVLALCVVPGCGLTLDYDPPTDAGTPLDAPALDARDRADAPPRLDAGMDAGPPCGGCPADHACFEGACRHTCAGEACSDDPAVCEACIAGLCMPVEVTCSGGSLCATAACDPLTDQCTTSSSCGPGLSCSMGECVPGACTGDADCTELVDSCSEAFVCGATSVCEPRVRGVCPAIAGSCAVVDPCTCALTDARDPALCGDLLCDPATANCVECLEATDCGSAQVCHPTRRTCVECVENGDCSVGVCDPSSNTCVECVDVTQCPDAGRSICDPSTRTCVECLGNADCTATAGFCASGVCVECLSSADCDASRPVCGADGSCGPCALDTDCGPGMGCVMGACVPSECTLDSDCPSVGCALGHCSSSGGAGRFCTYVTDDGYCGPGGLGDDFVACTRDACDPASGTPDLCLHRADDTLCPDDGYSCTFERCEASGIGGMFAGCTRLRNDSACAPAGTVLECAIGVCAGGEPGAIVNAETGCGLTYQPRLCGAGSVCTLDGQCNTAPSCSASFPCPNDGNLCNGVLMCLSGRCGLGTTSGGSCGSSPPCATYCASSGCALRTDPPRDATCPVAIP